MSEHINHVLSYFQVGSQPRWAKVTNYNPIYHTVVVEYPEGTSSGDLPIATMAASGTSIRYAPVAGEQVLVLPDMGDDENMIAIAFGHYDDYRPPAVAADIAGSPVQLQQGEIAIVTKDGITMRFGSGGVLYIKSNSVKIEGTSATLQLSDLLTVKAPQTNWTGDISLTGQLHATKDIISDMDVVDKVGSLNHLRLTYDAHSHGTGFARGVTTPTTSPDLGGT